MTAPEDPRVRVPWSFADVVMPRTEPEAESSWRQEQDSLLASAPESERWQAQATASA